MSLSFKTACDIVCSRTSGHDRSDTWGKDQAGKYSSATYEHMPLEKVSSSNIQLSLCHCLPLSGGFCHCIILSYPCPEIVFTGKKARGKAMEHGLNKDSAVPCFPGRGRPLDPAVALVTTPTTGGWLLLLREKQHVNKSSTFPRLLAGWWLCEPKALCTFFRFRLKV